MFVFFTIKKDFIAIKHHKVGYVSPFLLSSKHQIFFSSYSFELLETFKSKK